MINSNGGIIMFLYNNFIESTKQGIKIKYPIRNKNIESKKQIKKLRNKK